MIKVNGEYKTVTPYVKDNGVYKMTSEFVKGGGVYRPAGMRWAYNFDGLDDRGVLASRAINPDGDNTFEFWSPSGVSGGIIIAQNISATESLREFNLWRGGSGELNLTFGGVTTNLVTVAQGFKPSTRYGLILTGSSFQLLDGGLNGTLVRASSFVKGAAREPTAQTIICCRGNGAGSFANFFQGLQYNLLINGVLWPMADRNQTIQPSVPAGNNMTLVNTTSDRWVEVPQ